ncbi:hypothetical protein Pmani_024600 [Petrolisthes manimaculis]|uniref:Uncharacterized protein n=1 Tax=Petrolisthes manimaculis TaxID=1843537 RepID=A0AAE1P9Q6_9EUCA|nr:hypothetical protein Pmani_024600 [Petrolisthes manimaculis]
MSLLQNILQLLKTPGGPLQPLDPGREDRSGVYQHSAGASWEFGDSPIISRRRNRVPGASFSLQSSRSSSSDRTRTSSPGVVRSSAPRSVPGSPELRRCVWANPSQTNQQDALHPGRLSPPPLLVPCDDDSDPLPSTHTSHDSIISKDTTYLPSYKSPGSVTFEGRLRSDSEVQLCVDLTCGELLRTLEPQ